MTRYIPETSPKARSSTSAKNEEYERLADEYKISFHNDLESDIWPPEHSLIFKAVKDLSRTSWDDYTRSERTQQLAKGATCLANKAELCVTEQQNEAGWRDAIENELFACFAPTFTCLTCRKGAQKLIFGAKHVGEIDRDSNKQQRFYCLCTSTKLDDISDGYDFAPIFGTRLQQSFKHEPEIAKRLPKRTEQPDRVLGLRQTNMLKKLLRTSRYKSSISPYPLLDSPLLFPFLILESKSGKSTSDNHEIFMQTAFPIRRLLQLQKDLYALASSPAESSCPLVWFIFNRGGVWTVCACYVEGIGRNFRTHVKQLWSGSVGQCQGALQLLLIMEYIYEWAINTYEPAILQQLRSLKSDATLDEGDIEFSTVAENVASSSGDDTTCKATHPISQGRKKPVVQTSGAQQDLDAEDMPDLSPLTIASSDSPSPSGGVFLTKPSAISFTDAVAAPQSHLLESNDEVRYPTNRSERCRDKSIERADGHHEPHELKMELPERQTNFDNDFSGRNLVTNDVLSTEETADEESGIYGFFITLVIERQAKILREMKVLVESGKKADTTAATEPISTPVRITTPVQTPVQTPSPLKRQVERLLATIEVPNSGTKRRRSIIDLTCTTPQTE